MARSADVCALAGRILLASIFLYSGYMKIAAPGDTAGYMMQAGFPQFLVYPGVAVSILAEFGGALALVAGYKARLAAVFIFIWLIPVTLIFHAIPYREAVRSQKPAIAAQQKITLMKNVSIMGGLLMVAGLGAGAISLDARGHGAVRVTKRRPCLRQTIAERCAAATLLANENWRGAALFALSPRQSISDAVALADARVYRDAPSPSASLTNVCSSPVS